MSGQPLLPLHEVHLLGLPLKLAAGAQQHVDELLREFELVHSSTGAHEVPARLLALVEALTVRFAGVNEDARERLEAATDRGEQVIDDHVLLLPAEAGPASEELGAMLDEADAFCAAGTELLTLATPPDLVAYRRWYLSEVIAQLDGRSPTPWPAYCEGADQDWSTGSEALSYISDGAALLPPALLHLWTRSGVLRRRYELQTLTAHPDVGRVRRWYLGDVLAKLDGSVVCVRRRVTRPSGRARHRLGQLAKLLTPGPGTRP